MNTPLEADHPGPAELFPDQPTQTQDFGIGEILTEGTSNGDDREKQENNGGRNQTQNDEDLWKLVLERKKRGKPENRSEERESVICTGKLTQANPSIHPIPKHTPAPPQVSTSRPTYNWVRLAIRGDRETQATPRTDQKPPSNYFGKAAPTGASYAECMGKAHAPLRTTRGARIMVGKKEYEKRN